MYFLKTLLEHLFLLVFTNNSYWLKNLIWELSEIVIILNKSFKGFKMTIELKNESAGVHKFLEVINELSGIDNSLDKDI